MSKGKAEPFLVGLGVLFLVFIAVGPALWLKDYCSKTEVEGYPTAYHVTERSKTEIDGADSSGNQAIAQFSFGEPSSRHHGQIDRAHTTDYTAPEPYTFWRRFFCEINGADYAIALFTTILALFTVALAFATFRAANAAKIAAELVPALERAYVFVEITQEMIGMAIANGINKNWTPKPFVRFSVVNYGKTPALLKEVSAEILLQPNMQTPTFTRKKWENERVLLGAADTIGAVPPKTIDEMSGRFSAYHLCVRELPPLSPDTPFEDILKGRTFFWFSGQVVYDDVFGNEHVTPFWYRLEVSKADKKKTPNMDWKAKLKPYGGAEFHKRT